MYNRFSSVASLFPKFTFVYYRFNLKWNPNSFRNFLRGLEKDKLNGVASFVVTSTVFNMLTLPIIWVHAVRLFSLSFFSCSFLLLHGSQMIYITHKIKHFASCQQNLKSKASESTLFIRDFLLIIIYSKQKFDDATLLYEFLYLGIQHVQTCKVKLALKSNQD